MIAIIQNLGYLEFLREREIFSGFRPNTRLFLEKNKKGLPTDCSRNGVVAGGDGPTI